MVNLKVCPTGVSNVDEPDIMIALCRQKRDEISQKELKRLGYDVQDADGYSRCTMMKAQQVK